jgi:protein-S-isoprenylcysteine O-methyltransferase Ste14
VDSRTILAIAIGVLAFAVALFFDWISLKKIKKIKLFVALVTVGLHAYSFVLVLWNVEHFNIPAGLSIFGWIILPIFGFLSIYSLAFEVPSGKTYSQSGGSHSLTKTGSYALTRHPELLWYALFLIALFLISGSKVLIIAAPAWLVFKLANVFIQDKLLFEKMFPEYSQYKTETPMIIPSRKSIKVFWKTFKFRMNR